MLQLVCAVNELVTQQPQSWRAPEEFCKVMHRSPLVGLQRSIDPTLAQQQHRMLNACHTLARLWQQ